MTNLEKLVREFCKKNKNPYEKQCLAGDIACKILGCEDCPAGKDKDRSATCFVKLCKWAMKEAE